METSSVLAQRKISDSERGQKAVALLLLTAAADYLLWTASGGAVLTERAWLFGAGLVSVTGVAFALMVGLKRDESARSKEAARLLRMRIEDDREGRSWVRRLPFHAKLMLARLVVAAGLSGVFAGASLLAWQAYMFLRMDYWPRVSVLSLVRKFFPSLQLHEFVTAALGFLPASVAAVFAGLLVAGAASALLARLRFAGWRKG